MSWEHETLGWFKIKEGETVEFVIYKINKTEPYGKIKGIPGKSYLYQFETSMGTLTVNSLGLFQTCVEAKVREGDRIKVSYMKKGSLGHPSLYSVIVTQKGELSKNLSDSHDEQAPF